MIDDVAALPGVHDATGLIVGNVAAPNTPYFFVFGYDPASFAFARFRLVSGCPAGSATADRPEAAARSCWANRPLKRSK